jgi:lysophospholipase L1-like esterase
MDDPEPRSPHALKVRVIGTTLIVAVIVCAGATVAEVSGRMSPACFRSVIAHDPSVGWKLVSGADAKVFYRWSEDSVDFRFNASGFRDRDHARATPSGTKRIVVLGDSYTAGLEVPSRDLFATRLEARLNRAPAPPERYEVMNVAVPAWSTDQEWIELRDRVVRYEPDIVLLMVAPNDVREAYAKGFFRLDGERLVERVGDPVPIRVRVAWWLSNHSCAFQWLQARLDLRHGTASKIFEYYPVSFRVAARGASDADLFLLERPQEIEAAYSLFDALVGAIVDACRTRGCRPVLAVVPTKMEFDATLDSVAHRPGMVAAHVQALAQRLDVDYIDLFGPLEDDEDPLRHFIAEEYHLTPTGHAYVADRLAAWFDEERPDQQSRQ